MRHHLLLMAACTVLPFALYAVWAMASLHSRDMRRTASDLVTSVCALSVVPDQVFALSEARLRELLATAPASSPPTLQNAVAALRATAPARTLARMGSLRFYNARGRDVEAMSPVIPADPVPESWRQALTRVARDGRAEVTDLLDGRVGVLVPAPSGQPFAVTALWLAPETLSSALGRRLMRNDWTATLMDRHGVVVARTQGGDAMIGRPAPPEIVAGLARAPEGVLPYVRNQEGVMAIMAWSHLSTEGYSLVLSMPRAYFYQAMLWDYLPAAGVALLLLAGSLLLTLRITRRIRDALGLLADQGRSGTVLALPTGIREIAEVSAALSVAAVEREAVTAALRAQEARYRALVEASSELVWIADPSGRLLPEGAGAWARLTGLPVERLRRSGWFEALHPDDRSVADALWHASLASRRSYGGEWRIRRALPAGGGEAEGEARLYGWFSVRAVPLIEAGGRVREWVGLLEDVTEARAASRSLTESETRLRLAVEGDGLGTWDLDLRKQAGTLSPVAAQLLGVVPQGGRILAADWMAATHPEDRDRIGVAWQGLSREGDTFAVDFRPLRPAADGGEAWLEGRARVLRNEDGRAVRLVGVLRDVTDRIRAAEALRASEARFRTMAEAMPQIIWTCRPDGVPDYLNARWYEFTGQERGRSGDENWHRRLHPEDRERCMTLWRRCLESGEDYSIEIRFLGRDGAYHWFLVRALPQRDVSGRILRWLGSSTGIDEIVAAREDRARQAARLEQLVAERTAALTESERRLAQAQKMEALGRLAGGVAHDVNNVLQAVLGGARLMALRAEEPADVRRLARLVAEQAERGGAVTRRLLSFARQGELRAEAQDIGLLMTELREVLLHTLGGRVSIDLMADPALPLVLADRAQLETVLLNLAANARDAMPDGGMIQLSAEALELPGAITAPPALKPGRYLRLRVSDHGMGMAPEVLNRVTEPFFTTKPVGKGTGLGLAMARGFAEQSGGALEIDSRLGQGTVVSLWLPQTGNGAERAAETQPAPQGAPCRILLVDDEPMVRDVLAETLADAGHSLLCAEGPAEALRYLREGERPDLLVTDFAMPGGMTGLDLLRAVRDILPGLPALLVTGYAEGDTVAGVAQAMEGGPLLLLHKPVSGAMLLEAVARTVSGPCMANPTGVEPIRD
ncbi:PAS domain-containing protein [Roseomonas gilardii subsp. gilardii]|uniref:PAS domain-containing protein n=1 Tax=Roseomonas gilardii TaxID=257708 RepID=UPI001FF9A806|nr:PAS domain-containing protein [Roseomonas gilardii]UPG74070.1 PAS domain-containing protein [Roseomonas gilardii subsp. gilardii]